MESSAWWPRSRRAQAAALEPKAAMRVVGTFRSLATRTKPGAKNQSPASSTFPSRCRKPKACCPRSSSSPRRRIRLTPMSKTQNLRPGSSYNHLRTAKKARQSRSNPRSCASRPKKTATTMTLIFPRAMNADRLKTKMRRPWRKIGDVSKFKMRR